MQNSPTTDCPGKWLPGILKAADYAVRVGEFLLNFVTLKVENETFLLVQESSYGADLGSSAHTSPFILSLRSHRRY